MLGCAFEYLQSRASSGHSGHRNSGKFYLMLRVVSRGSNTERGGKVEGTAER